MLYVVGSLSIAMRYIYICVFFFVCLIVVRFVLRVVAVVVYVMLFAVCCVLFVVRSLSCVVRCVLFVCGLFVLWCLSFGVI